MISAIRRFQENHYRLFSLILGLVFGFFCAFIASALANLLYTHFPVSYFYNDSNMFYYMGQRLVAGDKPYIDFYDHKGLYIVYYHALGILLGGRVGMLIVEGITFGLFFFWLLLIARYLKFNKYWTLFLCLTFTGLYAITAQNPNDVEPTLPFMGGALYFFIRGRNGRSYKDFLFANAFAGFTAGISLNIRPSDCLVSLSLVFGFFVYVLIDRSIGVKKKITTLLYHAAITLAFLIAASFPPLVHGVLGGFAKQMYEATIFSNFKYVDRVATGMLVTYCRVAIIAGLISVIIPTLIKIDELGKTYFLVTFAVALVQFLVQFLIAYYIHYALISVPSLGIFWFEIASHYKMGKPLKKGIAGLVLISNLIGLIALRINYHLTQKKVDESVSAFVVDTIKGEDKNKTLCYLATPSLYQENGLVSPWPDFAVQGNHQLINPTLSIPNLVDFLSNGGARYVILMEEPVFVDSVIDYVRLGKDLNGLKKEKKFEKVDDSSYEGGKYIDIYRYIG